MAAGFWKLKLGKWEMDDLYSGSLSHLAGWLDGWMDGRSVSRLVMALF
jgi:hypothetical protein